MIELLLQAERALAVGLVDQAEHIYRQAADADPHNSIAVVGLARVALERSDEAEAYRQARRALEIDPENAAALRLTSRLEEVFAYRGQALPVDGPPEVAASGDSPAEPMPAGSSPSAASSSTPPSSTPASSSSPASSSPGSSSPSLPAARPPSIVDRLLRRNRP